VRWPARASSSNFTVLKQQGIPLQVYYLKELFARYCENKRVLMFVDVHGHSIKRNVFMYGCNSAAFGTSNFGHVAQHKEWFHREFALPKLFSERCSFLSYKDCHFEVSKSKAQTGRSVVFREYGIVHSYTLEASVCGADRPGHGLVHFSTDDLEEVGAEFLRVVAEYACTKESEWGTSDLAIREIQASAEPEGPPPGSSVLDFYYQSLASFKQRGPISITDLMSSLGTDPEDDKSGSSSESETSDEDEDRGGDGCFGEGKSAAGADIDDLDGAEPFAEAATSAPEPRPDASPETKHSHRSKHREESSEQLQQASAAPANQQPLAVSCQVPLAHEPPPALAPTESVARVAEEGLVPLQRPSTSAARVIPDASWAPSAPVSLSALLSSLPTISASGQPGGLSGGSGGDSGGQLSAVQSPRKSPRRSAEYSRGNALSMLETRRSRVVRPGTPPLRIDPALCVLSF
jgi:hypothetical protein